jgi:hypothetical protein
MRIRVALVAAAALAAGLVVSAPASAQQGSYCAVAGGIGAYSNCYYYSFAQCQAAVSGVGGYCQINPAVGRRSGLWWEDEQDDQPPPRRRRPRRY